MGRLPRPWERFTLTTPSAFKDQSVHDRTGNYSLFFRVGDSWPGASLLSEHPVVDVEWCGRAYYHGYTGESVGIRSRVNEHLSGSMFASNLRETLIALEASEAPHSALDVPAAERRLSERLGESVLIAYSTGGYVGDVEKEIISATSCPFNIKFVKDGEAVRLLKSARKALKARPEVAAAKALWDGAANRHRRR